MTATPQITFDELWSLSTAWAEQQSQRIIAQGRSLTDAESAIARKVGVHCPQNIRVLLVTTVPFPDDPRLRAIGTQVGFVQENTAGLTIGCGVFIREDEQRRPDLWPHEFRHVAQFEAIGSIRNATFFYLRELLHFKYGSGPMEIDAKAHEHVR